MSVACATLGAYPGGAHLGALPWGVCCHGRATLERVLRDVGRTCLEACASQCVLLSAQARVLRCVSLGALLVTGTWEVCLPVMHTFSFA